MESRSSETETPKVLSTTAPFPYPLLMSQQFTGINAIHRSESSSKTSAGVGPSSAAGATCFNAGDHLRPNNSFQRTLTPAGFGPLNSDR